MSIISRGVPVEPLFPPPSLTPAAVPVVATTDSTIAITGSPPVLTSSTSIIFTFTSDEEGSFECWLDAMSWALCTSPKSYFGLAERAPTFQVRAVDQAGSVNPNPRSHTLTVDTGSP